MVLNGPKADEPGDASRDHVVHSESLGSRPDDVATTPRLNAVDRHDHNKLSPGYLSAPLSAPVRPVSPDTLSNLSTDEYAQLHLERSGSRGDAPSLEPPSAVRTGWRGSLDRFWVRNKGLAYMLLGQVCGVLMNVTTRLLEIEGNKGKGLHPFQILFARMGITFVLATAYMWYKQTPDFPFGKREIRWLLVARGLCGFCGVFGMYYSLLYLPLADATVITFLAPSLACWACSILIKEPFTRLEKIGGFVSLLGVVLIARPTSLFAGMTRGGDGQDAVGTTDTALASNTTISDGSDASNYENVTSEQRLSAVGIAMIGVLGSAGVYTVIRWIGKRAHPLVTVNYFAGWCFFVSIVMQLALPEIGFLLPADLKEWGYLIFLGTCGFTMVPEYTPFTTYHQLTCSSNSFWPPDLHMRSPLERQI